MPFYTNPQYDSSAYGEMVVLLQRLADKRDITIIDLWNDAGFNGITAKHRALHGRWDTPYPGGPPGVVDAGYRADSISSHGGEIM